MRSEAHRAAAAYGPSREDFDAGTRTLESRHPAAVRDREDQERTEDEEPR